MGAPEYEEVLGKRVVDLFRLRELAWGGVPEEHRPRVWLILLGILDYNTQGHQAQIERKTLSYLRSIESLSVESSPAEEAEILLEERKKKQIEKDIKRMCTVIRGVEYAHVFYRAMAFTSRRRGAVGYVQGMCDIFKEFLKVFSSMDRGASEAMSYLSFSRLLGEVQEHFTERQEGVKKSVTAIDRLLRENDREAYLHLQRVGVETKYYAHKWMSTFLFREFEGEFLEVILDAHFSFGIGEFLRFNESFCVGIVISLKEEVLCRGFEEALVLLQGIGEYPWRMSQVREALARAFIVYANREGG
jgi:TBC1 domain family member 2